jgi:hypothetical protein
MWYWLVISGLLSGLVAVGVSTWYQKQSETKRIKLQVLQQLLGNRNDVWGEKFSEALNQVIVAFSGCNDVLGALKAFHEVMMNSQKTPDSIDQKLLDLFKAMCKHLKRDLGPLADDYLLYAFNIRPRKRV